MHSEVMTAIDQHLDRMLALRDRLAGARPVASGERLDAVLEAAASAELFALAIYGCYLDSCESSLDRLTDVNAVTSL